MTFEIAKSNTGATCQSVSLRVASPSPPLVKFFTSYLHKARFLFDRIVSPFILHNVDLARRGHGSRGTRRRIKQPRTGKYYFDTREANLNRKVYATREIKTQIEGEPTLTAPTAR